MDANKFLFQGDTSTMTPRLLPRTDPTERGYVCLIMLSNGYAKIMASCNPCERIKSMAQTLNGAAVTVTSIDITYPHINYKNNITILKKLFVEQPRMGGLVALKRDDATRAILGLPIQMDYTEAELNAQKEREKQSEIFLSQMFPVFSAYLNKK